jgi:hypothetical protein
VHSAWRAAVPRSRHPNRQKGPVRRLNPPQLIQRPAMSPARCAAPRDWRPPGLDSILVHWSIAWMGSPLQPSSESPEWPVSSSLSEVGCEQRQVGFAESFFGRWRYSIGNHIAGDLQRTNRRSRRQLAPYCFRTARINVELRLFQRYPNPNVSRFGALVS